jgi:glycosyltransferase involved in cell wall biosynthesis
MGGAERQALYLVEYLSGLTSCDVELLAFEDGTVIRKAMNGLDVPVHVIPYYFRWPRRRRIRALVRIAALIRFRIKPDVLLPFVGIHSKTAAMIWPYTRARFCWWNQQDEGRDLTGTPLEHRILRKVSCICSNSDAGKDFLVSTYGLDPTSVLVYNNGTPVPEIGAPHVWRNRLALGSRSIVTMVANITQYKDHATLLRSWALVVNELPLEQRPVLLLAGHLKEEQTVQGLKTLAFELGLSSEDIRFLGPVTDVQELIADSDLIVHSSTTEGCPNAVCEAMALGKPVVATNIPGCRQALGSGDWLAEPGDFTTLARLIVSLLKSHDLRTQLGRNNLERIAADFTIEQMNLFFVGQIERVIGRLR